MKFTLLSIMLFSTPLFFLNDVSAQFIPDSESGVTTAAQIKDAKHESLVILEGKITKHEREEYYEFADATGTVRVEIGDNVWKGVKVRPSDLVRLTGRVDFNSLRKRYVEITKVEKLN